VNGKNMMTKQRTAILLLVLPLSLFEAKRAPAPAWTDEATAVKEVEHYSLIGEYVSKEGGTALQANMLKDGTFLVAIYRKGLPGEGWDQSKVDSRVLSAGELEALLAGCTKVGRNSPTLGKPAPENAILVFPTDFTKVADGLMSAGGQTKKDLGSFKMHIEFMVPLKPGRNPSNQDRGNSGVYIFNNYELQIIDSFALDYENPENNAIAVKSINKQWCGSLYKQKLPDVNMSYPPLRWQTYDIDFIAPVIEGDEKVKNGRITVRHNGVVIHDDYELKTGTGNGAKRKQLALGPIYFQDHRNPIVFRNIWATELK
jgi:hypothetical protein